MKPILAVMLPAILSTTLAIGLVGCIANEPVQTKLITDVPTGVRAASTELLTLFPAFKASKINPDTHLVLTFSNPPTVGATGLIRIFDASDNTLVDTLDLSVPPSPRPSGRAPPRVAGDVNSGPSPANSSDKTQYQTNVIGGLDFHFFPIIVNGNVATIYPHNNVLKYGRTYVVRMDPGVLKTSSGDVAGFNDSDWTFTTKSAPPPANTQRVVVAADGSGDFNTVQGAIDFLPPSPAKRVTIFIKNGRYEEIVFMRDKSNVTFRGENRDKVQVGYRNNSAFNPSKPGPSRRPAFSIVNANDVQFSNFTINNYFIGQAEALLIRGERVVVDRMILNGSGDAMTTYGSIYMRDSKLTGHGDTILAYAALYCLRCEVQSIGPITWTRTPKGSHGNVFIDSILIGVDKPLPWTVTQTNPEGQKSKSVFARLPRNGPGTSAPNFPHAEMVLINTKTQGVPPEGWGPIEEAPGFDSSNVRFMEHNTMDINGRPIDLSQRHRIAKILTQPNDAKTIADYSNPVFVLGWKPVVH
jgi:pectinesterase